MTVPVIPDTPTGVQTVSQNIADPTVSTQKLKVNSDGSINVDQQGTVSVTGTLQSAQAASANGTPLALLGNASVIFTVNMAGFTGTVNFECTEDNTNYDPLQVQQEGLNLITTAITGATTTSIHAYEASVAGLQSVRARTSGVSAGTVTVTAHAIPTPDASRTINAVITDGQRATYSIAALALVPASSATDIFTITGSASKVVRLTRLEISGLQTTAGSVDVVILKRSTANTSGTSATLTPVPHDSGSPAAACTVRSYTANPTTGSLVGNLAAAKILVGAAATASDSSRLILDFGNRPSQAILVRGIAEVLAVNLNSQTITGGTLDIFCEFTEDVN